MIGLDVAKDKLDVYLLENNQHTVIKNDTKSIRAYLTHLTHKPSMNAANSL